MEEMKIFFQIVLYNFILIQKIYKLLYNTTSNK